MCKIDNLIIIKVANDTVINFGASRKPLNNSRFS